MNQTLLLAAYPARFRRRHGTELMTTLMEMGTPSRADLWHVVLDGLRERFRLPAARPVAVLAAVLALVIGGAVGAAAGSFAGTFGYAALPDARTLAGQAMPAVGPSAMLNDGDTYLTVADTLPPGAVPADVAERTRRRLAAAGWTTGPVTAGHFRAATGGVELSVHAYDAPTSMLQIAGWPARPASYGWLALGGALLGMLAGWLLAAYAAHRITAGRRRTAATVLGLTGLIALLAPSAMFTWSLAYYLTVVDPVGMGGLVTGFGPSLDLVRAVGLQGYLAVNQTYYQLTVLGLAAIAVALILARPRAAAPALRSA
ncbi:hypothetical protein [Actinoplanes sp. NPDC089786]|uniref:hypothetical protein n=1 Tax=Actinoplanes sp. NPDC089786 TaxID=3155185 RepID=UPI00341E12F4